MENGFPRMKDHHFVFIFLIFVQFFQRDIVWIIYNQVTNVVSINETDHDKVAWLVAFGIIRKVNFGFEGFMDSILTDKDLIFSACHVGLELAKVTHLPGRGAIVDLVLSFKEYDLFLDVKDLLLGRLDSDLVLGKEPVEA